MQLWGKEEEKGLELCWWLTHPEHKHLLQRTRLSTSDLGQQALVFKRYWPLMWAATGLGFQQTPLLTTQAYSPTLFLAGKAPVWLKGSLLGQARAEWHGLSPSSNPQGIRRFPSRRTFWLLQRDTGWGMFLFLPIAKRHRLRNVPLSASQSVCEGVSFNLSPPWNQEGELTTTEADRPRRWKDLDLDGIREDTASTSSTAIPTPTPRSGGCETMCPPSHYAKLPITRSWKHSNTLKSRSRCNLTKGAHFVNWLNTCQNVFVQHGSCCFTNKCNQGKGYFIFAICKCIATCFKFPASLKLANCWLLSKNSMKAFPALSSLFRCSLRLFLCIL